MSNSAQYAPSPEYLSCVEREEEMARLRNQAKMRKSMLVFGPEGVGKSRLLRKFVDSQSLALHVAQMRAPREFLLTLLHALQAADKATRVLGNLVSLSTASLKGIVHRALNTRPYLMVLDQLDSPSSVVTVEGQEVVPSSERLMGGL
jgi:AAA+ superfamily predicted ATPase